MVLFKDSLSLGVSCSSRTIRDIHAGGEMLRTSVGSNLQEYSVRVEAKPQNSMGSVVEPGRTWRLHWGHSIRVLAASPLGVALPDGIPDAKTRGAVCQRN